MARYGGIGGKVYLAKSGSDSASAVIGLSKWSLDTSADRIEVTAFGDGNKTYVQGFRDCKGSFEGYWDDTEDKIFGASTSAAACMMYVYPSTSAVSKYAGGHAWVNASIEVDAKGAVTIKGEYSASDTWVNTL